MWSTDFILFFKENTHTQRETRNYIFHQAYPLTLTREIFERNEDQTFQLLSNIIGDTPQQHEITIQRTTTRNDLKNRNLNFCVCVFVYQLIYSGLIIIQEFQQHRSHYFRTAHLFIHGNVVQADGIPNTVKKKYFLP